MRFSTSTDSAPIRYRPGQSPQRVCVLKLLRTYARNDKWASLEEIARALGMKDGPVGSRIRDLRVEGEIIEKRLFLEKGVRVFKYKLKKE